MKIRKQVQKQALEGPALLQEPGDQKLSRQISGETAPGGRLSAGKSVIGDSSLTRRKRVGALTTSSATSKEGGAAGGHDLQSGPTLEVHVAAPVDQTPLPESLEESNSETCGDWTLHQDDHNNAKRKYARRSLRSAGPVPDALVVQPQVNGSSNRQPVVAKVIQRSTHPSRREARCVGRKFPIGHPGGEPEGSLLHCLYLQLLAAGNEGMTLKEIFASFASQTEFSRLDCDWKIVLKSELKRNPYFQLVKARYFLDEREPQTPPSAPKAAKEIRSLMDLNVEPRASRRSFVSRDVKSRQVRQRETTVSTSPDPSVVVNNEREVAGVQTRRKTYERTIEAVLNESAVEFQKTQNVGQEISGDNRSTEELSTASRRSSGLHVAAPTIATSPECAPVGGPSKKRKSPVVGIHGVDIPEPSDFRHTGAVPGSLKAMQARIVAETGVQSGARCSRKDGSNVHSKWQCPMMAMEGRSLCQHHNFLSERKKARYKKARRQAGAGKKSPPPSPPPRKREREVGEEEKDSEEKGGSSRKGPMMTQLQDLNKPPRDCMEEEEEVHKQVEEVAAPPGDATMRTRSSNADANGGDGIVRTRSDTLANGSPAESANNAQITTVEVDSETEGGHAALAKSKSVNAPSSMAEVGRQPFRSTRKPRMYLAAKKTAEKTSVVAPAPGKSAKKQSVPLIRPPSIPPLPMLYGVRRKSMKNRPSQAALSSL